MKKKNILTAAVSLSLVACLSIGATLAYFTDKTDVQTNTFKAGNVDVTLIDQFDKTTTPKGSYVFDNHGVQTGIEYTNVCLAMFWIRMYRSWYGMARPMPIWQFW